MKTKLINHIAIAFAFIASSICAQTSTPYPPPPASNVPLASPPPASAPLASPPPASNAPLASPRPVPTAPLAGPSNAPKLPNADQVIQDAKRRVFQRHYEHALSEVMDFRKALLGSSDAAKTKELQARIEALEGFCRQLESEMKDLAKIDTAAKSAGLHPNTWSRYDELTPTADYPKVQRRYDYRPYILTPTADDPKVQSRYDYRLDTPYPNRR